MQNLSGLHLVDFLPDKIKVDVLSLKEYNRLRSTVNLQEFPLPSPPAKPSASSSANIVLPQPKKKRPSVPGRKLFSLF